MKKRNGWKWALAFAILSTYSTINLLTSNMYDSFVRWPYSAGFAVVLWILTFWLRSRAKQAEAAEAYEAAQKAANINNNTTPPAGHAPSMTVRASSSVVTSRVFPVAGVTFRNDDGSSRQEILREICEGELEGEADCWLEPYLYEGEMALHVKVGDKCVGNIRRSDVQKVSDRIMTSKHGSRLEAELFETDDGRELYRADVIFDD